MLQDTPQQLGPHASIDDHDVGGWLTVGMVCHCPSSADVSVFLKALHLPNY